MRKLIQISVIIVCALFGVRCEDPYMDQRFAAYENLPIGLWLESQPEYSSWAAMLRKAELYDGVNISTKFTGFVADNDAVSRYLKENGWESVEAMPQDKLVLLMRYHLIAGTSYKAKDLIGTLASRNLAGDYLAAKTTDGGYNGIYINQQAHVIASDIECLNGMVHKLDEVLRPVIESTWDLVNNERYSIFRDAAIRCGMVELMARYERMYGDAAIRDYKTVFVVSDSVFNSRRIYSADNLVEHLKEKNGISDGEKLLEEYISYHIVPEFADFQNLGTFNKESDVKVRNMNTCNTNQLISIADVKSELLFNRNGEDGRPVRLVEGHYDRLANNGYVHEVDGMLYVAQADAAVVTWELTDYDAFRMLEFYQRWSSQVDGFKYAVDRKIAEAEGVTWSTIPDDEEAVKYYFRTGQGTPGFTYNDAVTMTLGNVGWAEFRMPVIAKGKYEVIMYYLGYNARGTGRLYFDGLPFCEHAFTTSYDKKLGTIEFTEQSSHTFKVVVVKKGDMEIDRLVFKPIK